jgi:hypothetical protein
MVVAILGFGFAQNSFKGVGKPLLVTLDEEAHEIRQIHLYKSTGF